MFRKYLPVVLFSLIVLSATGQAHHAVRIGILTDCQYCNCSPSGKRNYTLSLEKLDSCIGVLNSQSLNAVFHLGDMIDHGYGNYDSILPRFKKFRAPFYPVMGNHDYMIKAAHKPGLLQRVGLKLGYYRVDLEDWTLLVLNGDDLSYFAPQDKQQRKERNEMVGDLWGTAKAHGMPWNGGIGNEQLRWLEGELSKTQKGGKKVVVMCHFPLWSRKDHNLYNRDEVFALIDRFSCVKAYFCGHYHSGSYHEKHGIHIVNFKGMVDTGINAFAIVTLTSDKIFIKGYGREVDRELRVR